MVSKKTRVGASVVVGGFVIAGGSMLIGGPGAANASAPAVSPAVKAQVAQKLAAAKVAPAAAPAPSYDEDAINAFFGKGYTYDDAVALGKMWHDDDILQVKADAGKKLEAGETLPVAPGSQAAQTDPATAEDADVNEFFAKGYTYDDAVKLAKAWGSATPYDAKVAAGKKLLAGETINP